MPTTQNTYTYRIEDMYHTLSPPIPLGWKVIGFRPCAARETYLTTDGKFTPAYKAVDSPTLPLIILERLYKIVTLTVKLPLDTALSIADTKVSVGVHSVTVLEIGEERYENW